MPNMAMAIVAVRNPEPRVRLQLEALPTQPILMPFGGPGLDKLLLRVDASHPSSGLSHTWLSERLVLHLHR
jgi:hypothetical protein